MSYPPICSGNSCIGVNYVNISSITCIKSIGRAHFCKKRASGIQTYHKKLNRQVKSKSKRELESGKRVEVVMVVVVVAVVQW